ncbi:MAG: trifunctional serine/threonine-protein kinase/ATP-binding protein/sensor histidine kinase, partial [Chroococcales cyanobacterium]
LLLVAGFSGIGKTAVINEVHKPIVRQRGYFIRGKFDQFNRNIPLDAFIQAFRDLVKQLLSESDQQLQIWKTKILAALAESAQVMIDLIPELERIIGPQPPAIELSGEAAQNRFNRLFQNFIQVFTTLEHPLVIFIDDLQWADSASLSLMQGLLTEAQCQYLLVLGAYRDNEVFPAHPFLMTVKALEKAAVTLTTLTLSPLGADSLNHLIADAFQAPESVVQPLTNLVMQKTQGNPFFATQFLKALHQDSLITFDGEARHWRCDLIQVMDAALTDDVVEFIALQLQKLPLATQEQLKFAACIGAQFDLKTLAIVSEQDPIQVASALWPALQEGLIVPQNKIYQFYLDDDQPHVHQASGEEISEQINYRFFHDRVQQAAYSLIASDQKQTTHLKIGQLLQTRLSAAEREENLFDIVGHLNLGRGLLSQPAERESLIRLNLTAIKKAKKATAYVAAGDLVSVGLELLSSTSWQTQYELTLSLHQMAAEVACLKGDFEEARYPIQQVLDNAQTVLDKVPVYIVQVRVLSAQNKLSEAIAVATQAITQLGLEFPLDITPSLTQKALQDVAMELEGNVIEDLVNLPVMTDPTVIAATKLLGMIIPIVFTAKPAFLPFVCAKIVSLSLQFGNAPISSAGYATYGMVLTTSLGQVEQGYRFGKMALALIDQLNTQEYKSLTILFFSTFVQHRQEPIVSMAALEKEGYLVGIETGNFLYAGYSLSVYFDASLFAGKELSDLQSELAQFCRIIAAFKQENALAYLYMKQQLFRLLVEINDYPTLLIGDAYDETKMLPEYLQNNELSGFCAAYTYKLILAYLFGDYNHALDYINEISEYLATISGSLHLAAVHFYGGLTCLAAVATATSEDERSKLLALAQQHWVSLSVWAENAPMNHQHKVDLLAAEKCRVLDNILEAIDGYERAIAGAKANGFIQDEALAHEVAAKFYLGWGKEKIAAVYMQDAYYCYTRWGAKAKVADLEQRYPELLGPILQPVIPSIDLLNTVSTISSTRVLSSTGVGRGSSSSINQSLDLASVIKASQALSGTLQLDELLSQLTQIILQNSGGDRCALIIPNDAGEWQVRAITTPDGVDLCTDGIDHNSDLPLKLIHYVKNTQQVVEIDNLVTDLPVLGRYLQTQRPKSVLCLPILTQRRCIGILYLQNQLSAGVFTSERRAVLNFLCTQAAISLENARLYQQVQQSLTDLQQAQLQLVQSEKMSALGGLVSGVAHEINNPVSCILGNVEATEHYFNDLLGLLELYGEVFPEPGDQIEAELEAVDLDYLREDLPLLIRAMRDSGDRIRSISQSLRTFSRKDTDHKQPFNLHDGIESTLLILRHRLKGNEHRPEIKVAKAYDWLHPVNCFPGQLNQVFMNILANAIDAFDDLANPSSLAERKAQNPQISIQIQKVKNWVEIKIADNGAGISPEIQSKIFDHLFTTKAVGKGTGLGLAIARQIVVDVHGGQLQVNSQIGQGTEFVISLPQS